MLDILLTPKQIESRLNRCLDNVIENVKQQLLVTTGAYSGNLSPATLVALESLLMAEVRYWLTIKRKKQAPKVIKCGIGPNIFLN